MPTYDDRKRSINYYGVFALWASILMFASYFSLYTSGCEEVATLDIQLSIAIAIVLGILVFLASFCNIAARLYHTKCIFYLIVLGLASLTILMLYISYRTLGNQCHLGRYYERNYQLFHNFTAKKNEFEETLRSIHQSRNNHYLVSAILDLLAGVLFAGSAYAFRNRF